MLNVIELLYITGRRSGDIAAAVEGAVREGRLQPGDRLPTVRGLAAELGVSPATVNAAYRELGRRGVAIGEGRAGTAIAPRPPLGRGIEVRVRTGLRDLATGRPDPLLLPDWTDVIAGLPRRSAQYGAPMVEPELADLARERLRADGVDATHLTVVSGAVDGMERVIGAHLRPGDAVAVEDPGYPPFVDLLRAMSLRPVPVGIDARGMVAEHLEAALHRGVRAVLLTPRSQNPFGSALDDLRRTELRRVLARRPEALVVEDDHAEGLGGGTVVGVALPDWPAWAVVRSVSKTLGPDLRVAVVSGDETTVARVEGRLATGPGWVSHLLQRLVIGLWSRPGLELLLSHAADTYRRRREGLIDALERHGVQARGATGLNVWVPVEAEAPVLAALADAGYAAQAGERFRIATPPAIRITAATLDPSEADWVAEAVAAAGGTGATRLA
ncbi:MAG TPA: aminotransferase class I/II-fold pyridoxal phosphate-dependent enzyme [Candidatus Binatia bacterium]|nr:aminotransferase class I/II-fold pyridoxal phosphate-dependent enzyme [Candidatus Binatia bacterium]